MTLYIKEPRPSVWDTFGPDRVRGHLTAEQEKPVDMLREMRRRHLASTSGTGTPVEGEKDTMVADKDPIGPSYSETAAQDLSSNHSLMRVFSVIFALE